MPFKRSSTDCSRGESATTCACIRKDLLSLIESKSVPQHLEWLESECDGFLSKHTQVGDSLETAGKLKSQYETFQETIEVSVQSSGVLKSGDLAFKITWVHMRSHDLLKIPSPSLQPTCSKLDAVVKQLLALKPKALPLATPIDRLCEVVRGRVEGRRAAVRDCWEILQMFVSFLALAEEVRNTRRRSMSCDS